MDTIDVVERLRHLARCDPDGALREAGEIVAGAGQDVGLRVRARHAAALARIERGQLAAAAGEVTALVGIATRAGLTELLPGLWLTLAWTDLDRGRLAAAERHLAAARPGLRGVDSARGRCATGLLRCAEGQHAAALEELSVAIPALRRHGDRHWLANALIGRGTVAGYLGRLREADADFAAAVELYGQLGERIRAAACVHNRGFVALQAGDLPAALHLFGQAEAGGLNSGRYPEILIDRAQALVAAGMPADARPVLARAATLLAGAGRGTKLAEATAAVAHCALRAGQPKVAVDAAARAAVLFGRQGRTSWRPSARAVELTARLATSPDGVGLGSVGKVAADCDRHGWWLAGAELRLAAAETVRPAVARVLLAEVAERRHGGPAALRALGWLARARLSALGSAGLAGSARSVSAAGASTVEAARAAGLADGRVRRAVLAACRAGLRAVDRDAATMGAWELQAGMSTHTVELADLGVQAAVAGGQPRAVLRWVDRYRAVSSDRPSVLPPADPVLAERLVALRSAIATAGSPGRVRRLEQQVRAQEWAIGHQSTDRSDWSFADLDAGLGRALLISFVVHGGWLHALSYVDHECRIHRLAKESSVNEAVRSLRFGETLALRGSASGGAARRSAIELDDLLFGPLADMAADRPLVVVPAGGLHAVPWAALPSCVGRPVSVVPSVGSWLRATRTPTVGDGERVWIAGPRLRHAAPEARSLHASHGGQLLVGRRATTAAALAAMDGAELVHVAAHGEFRADQPLFSAVELPDGPLFGYDIQRLRRAPKVVVLSACDAGRAAVRPGGEVMGMAAALLRCGTSTVVASVLPVPDRRAGRLVTALHDGLRSGLGMATALAEAQAKHGHLGFVCFGSG
jgi:tetratricopeptide (TPR) repeat protein